VVAGLDTDRGTAGAAPYRPFYPASTIKVPLVAAAFAAGLQPGATFVVRQENMTANDAPSPLVPGYRTTLHELMHRAIADSDNVATNELFDIVGRERATDLAATALGLRATRFARKLSGSDPLIEDPQWDGTSRNAHPAGDAARLFAAIARREIAGAAQIDRMLLAQRWNDKLSAGLRDGDVFAHKTGDTSEVTHDGGILTTAGGRRYVIVVYAGLPSTPENNARFGPFMRALREFL
jgi:beta-lactamase class A